MSKNLPNDAATRGLLPLSKGSPSTIPFHTRLGCDYFGVRFDVVDVPPWGIILPGETIDYPRSILWDVVVDTRGMPAGTVIAVRWKPSGEGPEHTLKRTLEGNEDSTRINVYWSIIEEAYEQSVLVQVEALPPDGNPFPGDSFELRMTSKLEPGTLQLGELSDGDILDPGKYPDGISGRIDPIGNLAGFNDLTLEWEVVGLLPGAGLETLYEWTSELPAAPGQPYEFVIPAEAYSGFEDPRFESIHVSFRPLVKLTPAPNPGFTYNIGGMALELLNGKRK